MSTKIITVKMKANKPAIVYFNPPLQNTQEIQLVEYHNNFDGFMIFCDAIDPNYSFSNISEKLEDKNIITIKPSNLLALFSDSKLYPKLKIQYSQELSNLTLEILNKDMTPLDFDELFL